MLERYFIRPATIDRIRSSWIGEAIERYVDWLAEHGYQPRNVFRRVPILRQFGEFTKTRGASSWEQLPEHVDAFVEAWLNDHSRSGQSQHARAKVACDARNPVEQMLRLVVTGFEGRGRPRIRQPFVDQAPGFLTYLRDERGVREATVKHYVHELRRFEGYLSRIGLEDLAGLSPAVLSSFIVAACPLLAKTSRTNLCVSLRVFLRYLHREHIVSRDLSHSVESPRAYRLASLPRSISWDDVRQVLEAPDRRSATGKRDYAMLMLLVTYGLRAREVAALKLDDIDWRDERLLVIWHTKFDKNRLVPMGPCLTTLLDGFLEQRRCGARSLPVDAPLFSFGGGQAIHPGTISQTFHQLVPRLGLTIPEGSSSPRVHDLRHSFAVGTLLRWYRSNINAADRLLHLAAFLGHADPASTAVYLTITEELLREANDRFERYAAPEVGDRT